MSNGRSELRLLTSHRPEVVVRLFSREMLRQLLEEGRDRPSRLLLERRPAIVRIEHRAHLVELPQRRPEMLVLPRDRRIPSEQRGEWRRPSHSKATSKNRARSDN